MTQADRIIRFIEKFKVTQGPNAGKPFQLMDWQRDFIKGCFGPVNKSAALAIARGNGKTTLLGAICAAAIIGPLRKQRAECIIVAASFSQALLTMEHAIAFLDSIGEDTSNRKIWKTINSATKAALEHKPTGARIRCLASRPSTLHGLAPNLAVIDEPFQIATANSNKLYSAIRTSLGKIEGSRLIALGTMPDDEDHWFSKMFKNKKVFSMKFVPTAKQIDERPFNLATIKRANPSMEFMPELKKQILKERDEAKLDASLAAQFKSLRLNSGDPDTLVREIIPISDYKSREVNDIEPVKPIVIGYDLGGGAAMTAAAVYSYKSGYLNAIACFPREPSIEVREKIDGADGLYQKMIERGELFLCGNHSVDLPAFIEIINKRFPPPAAITCDRWKMRELQDALEQTKVKVCPLISRGQGYKDGNEDVVAFRKAFAEGYVIPKESLLLRSALRFARTIQDPARNTKLAKRQEGDRKANQRDDAAAAALISVACGYRQAKHVGAPPPAGDQGWQVDAA